ncbi:MAG: CsbD family protein [Kouleothrix sp.]|nr:CsbD family protein [Kouleothrix sp.]
MGKGAERVKGKAQEIRGSVKERVGDLIDNEQMQVEGHIEKVKGQARQDVAKASERIRGVGEELVGKTKGAVGSLIGNEQMRVEGKASELKGKGRRKANR